MFKNKTIGFELFYHEPNELSVIIKKKAGKYIAKSSKLCINNHNF